MQSAKPRRWFVPRYSLRTLLIVVTLACLVSGFWLNKTIRERAAVRRFNQLAAMPFGDTEDGMQIPRMAIQRCQGYVAGREGPVHPVRDVIGYETPGDPIGVHLEKTATADDDLRYLKDIPSVQHVWLSHTKVTDAGMQHLTACPKLTFLTLNYTALTDKGLVEVAKLTELESLSLSGTKVTDVGLEYLARLTKLKSLWVRNTVITDAGYRKLQVALPECEIQADVPAYYDK